MALLPSRIHPGTVQRPIISYLLCDVRYPRFTLQLVPLFDQDVAHLIFRFVLVCATAGAAGRRTDNEVVDFSFELEFSCNLLANFYSPKLELLPNLNYISLIFSIFTNICKLYYPYTNLRCVIESRKYIFNCGSVSQS